MVLCVYLLNWLRLFAVVCCLLCCLFTVCAWGLMLVCCLCGDAVVARLVVWI